MEFQVNLVGRKNLSGEIYRQIRNAIGDGRLRPGDCLPASRDLAHSLKVSRTTVTVAYDRLAGEGFLVSRIGAGTFVNNQLVRTTREEKRRRVDGSLKPRAVWDSITLSRAFDKPAQFDFRTGLPDASLFPHETWRRLVVRALRVEAVAGGVYSEPAGYRGLREAIARHIGVSRGVQISADDITITSGAQQSLDLIARALLAPGDRVAVEDPGYHPPRFLFQSLGAVIHGVPVDDEGIIADQLPRNARLVYVTPSHQYPLGVTMSLPRRLALLDWADRNNAAIIEDDYDSEFRFEGRPVEPLHTIDVSGRVVYIGSFSKTLLPTLRLGFIATPPSCTSAVHKAKYVADWHTSMVLQVALAQFIDQGAFARHIRKVRRVYTERHERVVQILKKDFADHLEVIPAVAGLHIAAMARSASVDQISDVALRAAEVGVLVQRLAKFAINAPHPGLLFGYGAIPTSRIPEGLSLLRSCFDG
ncbi:MAG TPA: PLP-dependent aminotransferase family protein [Pyrinomonadaceae bacterium]|jgi:GntR family transcriptional regulator/MocR family aminotransferase|nr:PLP-dependent aminotransferase family protein [Pyrinomonadaceae bacterium]